MIEKWETLSKEFIGNFKIFDIFQYERKHPKTKKISKFYGLNSSNWVNIIPITKENEIILVEQYRHGSDVPEIEIPAGLIEPNEKPIVAAMRECMEETGYKGKEEPVFLGKVKPNPAFLNNYCFHYLWLNCEKKYEQSLDENEDINIIKIPFNQIKTMIENNEINHSLVISALFYYENKYKKI
jgi:8-oxo-dGTP pyrophosphatase MutT (NUDIX family)